MAEKQKTREEIVADWVASEKKKLRQGRKGKFVPEEVGVTINSLMDAMTIILVFLLMNYSVDPLRIDSSEDLKLPPSTTDIQPKASAAVTLTAKGIVVSDKIVAKVVNGAVDKVDKQGDETSLNIQPLFEALNQEASRQKELASQIGSKWDGVLTIIAHNETPYRLLTEVLYTAGQAEFQKYKFAVLKGGRRGL
jgi:hypothetical protein